MRIIGTTTPKLTFLYDEGRQAWKLSPAYDLTYSNSLGGEHATSVNSNPSRKDILAIAEHIGIAKTKANGVDQVEAAVADVLGNVSQYR